jgi:hypothetical protein
MAASMEELHKLHSLVTDSFKQRLEADIADKIPTDAATLGALTKFLKDNAVTADPQTQDDLKDLRDKFKQQSETRRDRAKAALTLVKEDEDRMVG